MKKKSRILHITDTHLFLTDDKSLLGVNTNRSFQAVINEVLSKKRHYDLIIATGDIVQDDSVEAYQRFADEIIKLSAPCIWLPGNHDDLAKMTSVFQQRELSDKKCVMLDEHWLVLLLNSQVDAVPYGRLNQKQLTWLQDCLVRYSDHPILIALHHHPFLSGCAWLDQHDLKNSDEFAAILSAHPNVRLLLCGHIHQDIDQIWSGKRIISTPSTCVQFKSNSDHFCLDHTKQPGWREIILYEDGMIETMVYYLSGNEFNPDMTIKGY